MPADDVIRLVAALDAPYGLERSVKITQGSLAADRCLLSVGRDALGRDPAARIAEIGRSLGLPPHFAAEVPTALAGADVVHFGYEGAAGRDIHKIYFEYATQVRRAMASPARAPVLVHLAYKWTPGKADKGAVTRYIWAPYRTRGELEQKLQALVPAREAPRANRCALALVARLAALAESGEALLMEVEEPGNPRRSCDLNVYDAELRMKDVADLIDAATADFAIPKARAEAVFEGAGPRMLGHLSAGLGRDGGEFVTIYFGVEAH
jgi:tryptophan halogenase